MAWQKGEKIIISISPVSKTIRVSVPQESNYHRPPGSPNQDECQQSPPPSQQGAPLPEQHSLMSSRWFDGQHPEDFSVLYFILFSLFFCVMEAEGHLIGWCRCGGMTGHAYRRSAHPHTGGSPGSLAAPTPPERSCAPPSFLYRHYHLVVTS